MTLVSARLESGLFTPEELAEVFGVSTRTMYRFLESHETITHYRLGRKRFFRLTDVIARMKVHQSCESDGQSTEGRTVHATTTWSGMSGGAASSDPHDAPGDATQWSTPESTSPQ
ncbi:MAG TPA: DNA-binding protein, partial [Planctomycetaceae bacterium]|nr:DNA-binding protein [Planctomycetaceae bacterium]